MGSNIATEDGVGTSVTPWVQIKLHRSVWEQATHHGFKDSVRGWCVNKRHTMGSNKATYVGVGTSDTPWVPM